MRSAWWLALVAGCGSKAAPQRDVVEVPEARPRIALAAVPPAALGMVHAASYLTVAADGALAIGRIDTRGEVDVSSLAATPTEDLSAWYSTREPPVPRSADALADAGVFGAMLGGGGLGGAFGRIDFDGQGLEGFGEPVMRACGNALHLDARLEVPVALLIPDAGVDARVLLDVMEQMPRPVALIARGDDPRGLALRLIADHSAVITTTDRVHVTAGADVDVRSARDQAAIVVHDGATAQDLLAMLGGLAAAGVWEVVLDRGVECADYSESGGFSFGGDDGGGWGEPMGGDGWGTVSSGGGGGTIRGGPPVEMPSVTVGAITVKGGASEGVIRADLEQVVPELERCYLEAMIENDALAGGDLTVKLILDEDGQVSSVKASGLDEGLARCVEGVVGARSIATTGDDGGGAGVTLTFDPGDG